jgi:hypothetical protein
MVFADANESRPPDACERQREEVPMEAQEFGYPFVARVRNAFYFILMLGFVMGGLYFIFVIRPEPWQAYVGASVVILFCGSVAWLHIAQERTLAQTLRFDGEGVLISRWGTEVDRFSWNDVASVENKGAFGGIWINTRARKRALAIEHTIVRLEELRSLLRDRVGNPDRPSDS